MSASVENVGTDSVIPIDTVLLADTWLILLKYWRVTPVVAAIPAATSELIFNTLPLDAAFDTTVVIPKAPLPPVVTAIPAWKVSIYQPNTIDKAIALPGDVLPLIDVSNALPDLAAIACVASDAVPVRFPLKLVAVETPVTTEPAGKVGAPAPSLSKMLSTCILDIMCF